MVFLLIFISATVSTINAKIQQPTLSSNGNISVYEAIRILEEVVKEEKIVEQFCYKHYCEIKEDKVGTSTTEKPSTTEQTPGLFSCSDLYNSGFRETGIYFIDLKKPLSSGLKTVPVNCSMSSEGGSTVIQVRSQYNVRENFYRNWTDYKNGFGNLKEEFWLGNEIIHRLTNQENVTLQILLLSEVNFFYATYDNFEIADEKDGYRLNVGNYSGNADILDSLNGMEFYTYDHDDTNGCARKTRGGWWFNSNRCIDSHLNGAAYEDGKDTHGSGIVWDKHKLKISIMSIRTVKFKKGSTG